MHTLQMQAMDPEQLAALQQCVDSATLQQMYQHQAAMYQQHNHDPHGMQSALMALIDPAPAQGASGPLVLTEDALQLPPLGPQ